MRGNLVLLSAIDARSGSIPAYAGEPAFARCEGHNSGVYPRVCGGTSPAAVKMVGAGGLSPRMRGNRLSPVAGIFLLRSIPAYAGEPTLPFCRCCPARVYPRVCGGTWKPECKCRRKTGLSPRMRGNRRLTCTPPLPRRSIPAYAGEPWTAPPASGSTPVYPRVCGGTGSAGCSANCT